MLHDDTFIKMKPTIIYVLFGGVLLGGLVFNKPLLAIVFDSVFDLTDEGWRKLTLRWAMFFLALAVLNEIVWRTQTTDFWVSFKVFGVMPLTFVFAALQFPLLQKYATDEGRMSGCHPTEVHNWNHHGRARSSRTTHMHKGAIRTYVRHDFDARELARRPRSKIMGTIKKVAFSCQRLHKNFLEKIIATLPQGMDLACHSTGRLNSKR